MSKSSYDHLMSTNVFNISSKVKKQQKKNGQSKRAVSANERTRGKR
jgi:hypothetical protein